MIYCFDIDGTITETQGNDYEGAIPNQLMIDKVNSLFEEGHRIIFFTARGGTSGIDWSEFTEKQLKGWGIKYHDLIMNQKPHFDLLIDDKCVNVEAWKKQNIPQRKGFLAGCFDVIHPGYVKMWQDAKTVCDYLIVGLQTDPTIDRPSKMKPLLSVEDRKEILLSIKYIDEIVVYETENDLYELLKTLDYDVRILGDDYKDKKYTGYNMAPAYFCSRNHGWSATKYKNKIKEGIL
jgi:glycerol-3-phosphate cytidylyltransferase